MFRPKPDNHDLVLQILQNIKETKTVCTETHKAVAALKDHFKKSMHPSQQEADPDWSPMLTDTPSGRATNPRQQQVEGMKTDHARRGANQTPRSKTSQQLGRQSGRVENLLSPGIPPPGGKAEFDPYIMVLPSQHNPNFGPHRQIPASPNCAQALDPPTSASGYRMNDMEQEIIKELEQTRRERDQMKKDAEKWKNTYEEFKQRMQNQVSNELDCNRACSENIMDPCRESEVVRMYDNMKTQSWGETKEKLWKMYDFQSTDLREHAAMLIKMMFELAVQYVEKIRCFIDKTCRVQTATSQKTACQNKITHGFQLFFYYCDLDYFKSVVKEYVSQHCTGHGGACIDLAAECYKVATLMALHEPQLRHDWEERWWYTSKSQKVFPAIYKNNCIICHSE